MNRRVPALPLVLSALLLAGLPPLKSAVSPAGPAREHASVNLVEVPVTVLDRAGKPVAGLTAADFEVRDDGKPVKIEGVDVTEFSTAGSASKNPAAPTPAVDAAARRRFLLLFDLSFSTPSRVVRIRDAARKFVTQQLGPQDLAAVATYSVERGFNLIVSFTSDRRELEGAVATLGLENRSEKPADPLQLTRLYGLDTDGAAGVANWGGGRWAGLLAQNLREMGAASKRNDEEYRRGRVTQMLQNFGTLAKALNAVEGRKQVIFFSQGFDMRLVQGNTQDMQSARDQGASATEGRLWEVDSQQRFGNSGLQSQLTTVMDLFRRSDCVIHAVDLTGLSARGSAGEATSDKDETDPSGGTGRSALFAFTKGTGGELFENANGFDQQLDRLLEEQSIVYVLTFSAKLTGNPDKFHELRVKTTRSGARVSARAGYYEPRPFSLVAATERRLAAADVVSAEIPVRELGTSMLAYSFAGKEKPEIDLQIHVPAADLISRARDGKLPIEIYAYAVDASGNIADFSTQIATLDVAQVKAKLESGGLRYFAQFRVAPGTYRIKTLVREGNSGAMGYAANDVLVPDFSQKTAFLVAPIGVGSPDGLVLRGASARSGVMQGFPFMTGSNPYLPSPVPSVVHGQDVRLCLYSYGIAEGSTPRLGGQLLDASGKVVKVADLSLEGRAPADAFGRSTYLLDFKPGDVPAGSYRLRVMLQDDSGAGRQATTPIEVH